MALSPRSAPVSDRLRMVTSFAETSSSAYWPGPLLPRLSRAVLPLVGPRTCTPESPAAIRTFVGRVYVPLSTKILSPGFKS